MVDFAPDDFSVPELEATRTKSRDMEYIERVVRKYWDDPQVPRIEIARHLGVPTSTMYDLARRIKAAGEQS